MSSAAVECNPLAHFTFPRTGKRGVPQQFPRRLYEMLEGEAKLSEQDPNHHRVISWSDSGHAFRIYNVNEFANVILPKYFRTKKFSSFQRNLNLYGFAKVRRGPETDMYAHPFFLRDQPKSLLNLRKLNAASRKRFVSDATNSTLVPVRSVSPSLASSPPSSPQQVPAIIEAPQTQGHGFQGNITALEVPKIIHAVKHQHNETAPLPPYMVSPSNKTVTDNKTACDRGKLDLLALAMEQEFTSTRP